MTKTFLDLGVDPALCDALAENGITHPFPIQELTLPLALEGHDLIGQARTGTGKTLAFGLPLLQRLDSASTHTQALVIVPTRELCLQVYSDLQIGAAKGLTSISVYGGVGYDEQIDALTAGAHVVVGTPGRLLDLLNRGVLDLTHVTQLVLDEADEMLDMGFLPDVERLVESCQGDDRHTMLFSATMPTAIVKLARRYMDHPTFTRADHEQKNTAPLVTQYFFEVHRMDKPRLLARILQSKDRGGVYVFVRTKHMADRLVNDLEELRIPSIAIHGDLRQSTREKNLDRFRSGQATVLVCTEVAARGLDVTGVTHVINYDCPDDEKMYLHRIGRTARAGEAGVAITFAEFNEKDRLNVIRKAVGATEDEVQQVFSTSKQLAEMFELPEERPWDHLSTKAGSDEARAKRESRTDGKPKSGRTPEGRGGGHDARGPGGRGQGHEKGGGRGSDKPRGKERSKATDEPRGKTTVEPRGKATVEPRADDAKPQEDASKESASKREPRERDSAATGGGRDRDRRGARSRDRKPDGGRAEVTADATSESASDATSESAADATSEAASDAATTTTGSRASGDGTGEVVRTRTRTRARASSARNGTPDRDRSPAPPASSDESTETDGAEVADAGTGASTGRSRGSGGRQRARSGGQRGGDKQERSEPAAGEGGGGGRSGGGRSGGGRQDERGKERSGREDKRSDKRKEGASRGERSREARSGRNDRPSEAEGTIATAKRGEDARGDGQPQVARRVKIEHLP